MLISSWARDGAGEKEIAKRIGISVRVLSRWKRKYPEILAALNQKKELVDIEVENALLRRCLGYEYTEKKLKTTKGGEEEVITKKLMHPDLSAIMIWLKNRQGDKWREKQGDENLELLKKVDEILEEIEDAAL